MEKLAKAQGRLAEVAIPACIEKTGTLSGEFSVVEEVGSDGYVERCWRHWAFVFAVCFQECMENDFEFWPFTVPFFTSFEYTNVSLQSIAVGSPTAR